MVSEKNSKQEKFRDGKYDTVMETEDHGAIIYVIAPDENGPCKIGFTQNIGTRLSGIQVGCWLPLAVFAVRLCFTRTSGHIPSLWGAMLSGARHVESKVHRQLKECEVHLSGEWFDISVDEAVQTIEKVANETEAAAVTLEQMSCAELLPAATRLERDTQASLVKSLYQANAFARASLDRLR